MKICIVSKMNGHGLAKDIEIIKNSLPPYCIVTIKSPRDITYIECIMPNKYDVVIDLEVPHLKSRYIAKCHVVIPNQEIMQSKHLRLLSAKSIIWAKTKHAESIFKNKGFLVRYLGFTSQDLTNNEYSRKWKSVLHIAGKSPNRGTNFIIDLWKKRPDYPKIIIVKNSVDGLKNTIPNIELITDYLSDDAIVKLRNECGIHICPSQVEGWGHNIVEGMGVGAVIVTLNAPPMNEHINGKIGYLIPSSVNKAHGLDLSSVPNMDAFEAIMDEIFSENDQILMEKAEQARELFQEQSKRFKVKLNELLVGLEVK